MKPTATTIDEYILQYPPEVKALMNTLPYYRAAAGCSKENRQATGGYDCRYHTGTLSEQRGTRNEQ